MLTALKKELRQLGNPEKALNAARFFKTGPGQYGEGDIFIGVTTPEMHKVAKNYRDLSLADLETLLKSREHEFRSTALAILVDRYSSGTPADKKKIHALYLANTASINNWDLVDASAIVGEHLAGGDLKKLAKLARSESLWERRIAIIATYAYIKKGDSKPTFAIAEMLLDDRHDLIHKAVGWMLREVGKRCSKEEEELFLRKHYREMPRTMLRYAIERFPEKERKSYMKGTA